jgi:hypothetical protein
MMLSYTNKANYLDSDYTFLIPTFGTSVACASIVFIYVFAKLWTAGRRQRGLPPGPPTTPVLGNALQFPKSFPHVQCV